MFTPCVIKCATWSIIFITVTLQERHVFSNHRQLGYVSNILFRPLPMKYQSSASMALWREFTGTQRDCNAESPSIPGHHVIYLVKPASYSTWYIALYDTTALQTTALVQGFKSKYCMKWNTLNVNDQQWHSHIWIILFSNITDLVAFFVNITQLSSLVTPGPLVCLLHGVSSGCARPITRQITSVTWPLICRAYSEIAPSERQKSNPVLMRNS